MVFNGGGNGSTTPNLTVVGTAAAALNFGANPFTLFQNTSTKQIIAVPIQGSGDMTVVNNAAGSASPIDLAGTLTGFTGNIIVNNAATTPSLTAGTIIQLDSPTGDPTKTIKLDQFTTLTTDNQIGTPGRPSPSRTAWQQRPGPWCAR